jgi:hypothetical protein
MYSSRVEVVGYGKFDAREWLRQDVLWASFMSPYAQQMGDFLKDNGYPALQQHNGNVGRRDTYSKESDVTAQSLSFFHQGKNVAGLISSAVMLRAFMHGLEEGRMGAHPERALGIQAKCIDIALGSLVKRLPDVVPDDEAYQICSKQAQAAQSSKYSFGNKSRLLRASNMMCALAQKEATQWIEDSRQNDEQSLPALTINPGGSPRSAGPRVDALQPVFQRTLGSRSYKSLCVAA